VGFTRFLFSLWYRYFRVPWDIGPRKELVELVESGRIPPSKAIDLGSGTASNCIYLAERGFDVTGVDFAPGAVELGRKRAREAGVSVTFVQDDLTDLRHIDGAFDLLVDYGTLDDLSPSARNLYMENVIPLTHPGSLFLLFCFEYEPHSWERLVHSRMAFVPGEAQRRFGPYFDIERYAGEPLDSGFIRGWAVYFMVRKGNSS
jgi:SAM-dependent methyltransferase